MRFTTDLLNIKDFFEELTASQQENVTEDHEHMQFQYDFPDCDDDDKASKLELSDGDLNIMVSLLFDGIETGEQEYWYEDENEEEKSLRLTWQLA